MADFPKTVEEAAQVIDRHADEFGGTAFMVNRDIAARLRSGLAEHEALVREEERAKTQIEIANQLLALSRLRAKKLGDRITGRVLRCFEWDLRDHARALRSPPSPEPVTPPEPPVPVLGTPNDQGPYPVADDTTPGNDCHAEVPFVVLGRPIVFNCTRPPNHAPDYHVAHGEGLCGYVRIAPTPPAATEAGTPETWEQAQREGWTREVTQDEQGRRVTEFVPPPPDAGGRREEDNEKWCWNCTHQPLPTDVEPCFSCLDHSRWTRREGGEP